MNVNLENDYLPFVIAQEMGYDAELEALKAHAIAARSYALHTVEFSELNNSASSGGQVFLPYSVTPNTNHYRAASETRSMIVICNNNTDCEPPRRGYPAFAEHSAGHNGDFTSAWLWNNVTRHLYLASIYDPIHTSANGGHGRGLSQEGAKRWATGVVDGNNHYPEWDFRRILAHYYTGIEFQNVPDTINGYRFNVIEIGNLTPGEVIYDNNPVKDGLVVDVQNTGTNTWQIGKDFTDSCRSGTHNLALSYHIYDENNNQPACDYSGGNPGGGKCFERTRYLMCWQNFTTVRPGDAFRLTGVKIELPPELPPDRCYNIRWDIELFNNHQETTWISRLQQPPYNRDLWPPQDTRICYVRAGSGGGDPDPPKNPGSSTHTANVWSDKTNITVTWDPPNGPVSGYEYKYDGAGAAVIDDGQWHSTGQTHASFATTQDGNHRLKVRSVLGSNTSNRVEAGPYLVDRQSPFLSIGSPNHNWVTTNNFNLNWTGGDSSSGLSHYDLYSGPGSAGPWMPLAQNTTQEIYAFTGADDQYYTFKIVVYDKVGNSSERQKTVQVRTFPYLSVSPNPLYWTQTLSDTAPRIISLQILNNGGKVMTWTAQTDLAYLTLPLTNGVDDTTMPITLTHPLTYGTFTGVLTVTGTAETRYSPLTVPVTIEIIDKFPYYLPIIFK